MVTWAQWSITKSKHLGADQDSSWVTLPCISPHWYLIAQLFSCLTPRRTKKEVSAGGTVDLIPSATQEIASRHQWTQICGKHGTNPCTDSKDSRETICRWQRSLVPQSCLQWKPTGPHQLHHKKNCKTKDRVLKTSWALLLVTDPSRKSQHCDQSSMTQSVPAKPEYSTAVSDPGRKWHLARGKQSVSWQEPGWGGHHTLSLGWEGDRVWQLEGWKPWSHHRSLWTELQF
jgi:hypothetical protein